MPEGECHICEYILISDMIYVVIWPTNKNMFVVTSCRYDVK